jgi:hypothetical protein
MTSKTSAGTETRDAVFALARVSCHPGFQRMLEEIRSASPTARIPTLVRLMNVREMRARGIRLPEGAHVIVAASSHDALDLTTPEPPIQKFDFEVCIKVGIPFTPIEVSKCWTITIDIDIDID